MAWKAKLCQAGWQAGCRTIDLAATPGPAMITLDELDHYARSNYELAHGKSWGDLGSHLRGLSAMGVQTCGIRAYSGKVGILIGRISPDNSLDIPEAHDYFLSMETWLRQLERILPDFKLSDEDKKRASDLAGALIGPVAGADTAALVASTLIQLSEAGRHGVCITFHVVSGANDQYRRSWSTTDMVSVPVLGIANTNLLWVTPTDELVEAQHNAVENWQNGVPDISIARLTALLRSVRG